MLPCVCQLREMFCYIPEIIVFLILHSDCEKHLTVKHFYSSYYDLDMDIGHKGAATLEYWTCGRVGTCNCKCGVGTQAKRLASQAASSH